MVTVDDGRAGARADRSRYWRRNRRRGPAKRRDASCYASEATTPESLTAAGPLFWPPTLLLYAPTPLARCGGVPGGWRDWWDDPDDSAQLRAKAEASERRQLRRAAVLGVVWQGEIAEERQQRARERRRR